MLNIVGSMLALCLFVLKAHATPASAWPRTVQPFFLSALNELTAAGAAYIGRFPVAVINHKQGRSAKPAGQAEKKEIAALTAIKQANSSCTTFFYLNSQIDFPELSMHSAFAAPSVKGDWWLRDDSGAFLFHGNDHIIDWTAEGARDEWIRTAVTSVVDSRWVDGIFVDKAGSARFKHISTARMAEWNEGHDLLFRMLRNVTAPANKKVILNNVYRLQDANLSLPGVGQLFERWGGNPDHDGLNITEDIALMGNLSRNNIFGLLARPGAAPRSQNGGPVGCGTALAQFLIAVEAPNVAFFSCELSFASGPDAGWMTLLEDSIYSQPLGQPLTAQATARISTGGAALLRREFDSGTVAWLDPTQPNLGCVKWAGGSVNGTCPPGVNSTTPQ